jgi:predicted nucleic acid-binding Zn ribbon protein
MPTYVFICKRCVQEDEVFLKVADLSSYHHSCSVCKGPCDRRYFPTTFIFKGWSCAKELKKDAQERKAEAALVDESPITQTMHETAAEQLERRAEKRGEKKEDMLKDILGIQGKQAPVTKSDLAKKAKSQREMIDRKET